MSKTRTLVIFAGGLWIGRAIGIFQTMVEWAESYPEEPEAQEFLESLERLEVTSKKLLHTLKRIPGRMWTNIKFRQIARNNNMR